MADFYETPSDEIFDEIKINSIALWKGRYSDEHGYVTEKTSYIETVQNYKDNWNAIFGMFDHQNQIIILASISEEARKFILDKTRNLFGTFYEER